MSYPSNSSDAERVSLILSHPEKNYGGTIYGQCSHCQKLASENEILRIKLKEVEDMNEKMDQYYKVSYVNLAITRLPALITTLGLELAGGIIIDTLNDVIVKYALIASFMPTISALSGNLGLQAGSNTTRGLGTGHIVPGQYMANIWKEVKSGLVSATILSLVLFGIATTWSYFGMDDVNIIKRYPHHHWLFGALIFVGSFASMMVATINGAGTPILATYFNWDPSKIAGPLETAFQDIVGQSFLLGVSFAVFSWLEP